MDLNVRDAIASLPQQLIAERTLIHGEAISREHKKIVVCGMGGSGVVGDFLRTLYPHHNITVHKDYGLPHPGDRETLYLIVSYSGETRETLSVYDKVLSQGLACGVVTGGGALRARAEEARTPHVIIPHTPLPARFNLGALLSASLTILQHTGAAMDAPSKLFETLTDTLTVNQEKQGGALADTLANKTILLYTPTGLHALGVFWKMMLNETAGVPAFVSPLPEALHNELESIDALAAPHLLLLQNPKEDSRLREHIEALVRLAEARSWDTTTISLENGPLVRAIVNAVIFADWTACALAERRNVDPFAAPVIEELKGMLS